MELQLFQLKPIQSIAIYRHRNLDTMAGLGGEDLGKGSEKSSPNRAGLGKGGPRHSQKPRPDVGLLTEAMAAPLATTHTADYHAMVKLIELWRVGKGRAQPFLARTPELNSGGYTQVWASLKSERLGCAGT